MMIMTMFCDHKLSGLNFNFKVMLLLQVSVKLLCLQLASGSVQASCNDGEAIPVDPQAPECLDDCEGRRFFLDRDGLCKMCVQCEPGFEHDKYCGDGDNGDAICIPCLEDYYSYNLYDCVACRVCENTILTQECSATTDRQCGECLPGFYRDPQNPDLCNQRCERLSNPQTIPACQAWLANQQKTTQSASTSEMSSFPGFPTERTGGVSLTVIIIVSLVVVLICGSVIPVYLCCKHCKNSRVSKTTEDIEHLEPADVSPDECRDSDGSIVSGIDDDGVEMDIAKPKASEVVRVLHVSTVQEQLHGGGSVANEGGDKDPDKPVLDVYDCVNEIDYHNSMSNSQMNRSSSNCNAEIPSVSLKGAEVRRGDDEHDGSGEELESLLPDAQVNHHHGEADEEKLRGSADAEKPDGPSRNNHRPSKESTVISHENGEDMPTGLDSEKTKRNVGGAENDEEDVGKTGKEDPDECQRLLSDKQVNDHDRGATGGDDREWRGSAVAEISQPMKPTKRKKKDAFRETKSGQLSAKRGKKKSGQQKVILHIENLGTLVTGDQYNYHNSAEHSPQGNAMHLNEDSKDDDDEDEDHDEEGEEEDEEEEEEEEEEEDKVSSDNK